MGKVVESAECGFIIGHPPCRVATPPVSPIPALPYPTLPPSHSAPHNRVCSAQTHFKMGAPLTT